MVTRKFILWNENFSAKWDSFLSQAWSYKNMLNTKDVNKRWMRNLKYIKTDNLVKKSTKSPLTSLKKVPPVTNSVNVILSHLSLHGVWGSLRQGPHFLTFNPYFFSYHLCLLIFIFYFILPILSQWFRIW